MRSKHVAICIDLIKTHNVNGDSHRMHR